MEQTPSLPGRSPELPSISPLPSGEVPGVISSPEAMTGSVVERKEQHGEAVQGATQVTVLPPAMPDPMVVQPPASTAGGASVVADDLPSVAGDDELIEKEWVSKAKKVIAETKDDPYRREQEVNRLQADYLSKRYGRQLGGAGADS